MASACSWSQCGRVHRAFSADPRASGTPAGDHRSTVTCGSSSLRYRCADWEWAGPRLVRLAARQLTAVARPVPGSGFMGPIMCPFMPAITIGIRHLWSRSFVGPPSAYASARCGRAATTDPRRAALRLIACPCWPTLIRRLEVPCASEKEGQTPSSVDSFKTEGIPHRTEAS
jgi:hypothetical protein